MLHLGLVRVLGWLALLTRTDAANKRPDPALRLVLRQEVAVLGRQAAAVVAGSAMRRVLTVRAEVRAPPISPAPTTTT
jgi:hypothetical protein